MYMSMYGEMHNLHWHEACSDRIKLYLAGFKVCRTLSQSPTFHSPFIFLNHAIHLTHSAPINV